MSDFKKVSELTSEDTSKLKQYWGQLWGKEFASALTKHYTPDGKQKEVAAKSDKTTK